MLDRTVSGRYPLFSSPPRGLAGRGAVSSTGLVAVAIVVAGSVTGCGGDDRAEPVPPAPIESRRGPAEIDDSQVRPPSTKPLNAQLGLPTPTDDPTDPQNWRISGPEDDPRRLEVGGLHALKSPTWTWQRPSAQFRTLQYTVPGRDGGDSADLVVSLFFGREGGPLSLNIERWNRQFLDENGEATEPVRNELLEGIEADVDMPITVVEHRGSYLSMGAAAPRSGYAQLVAIVEAPIRRLFIRLSGPAPTVEANREQFLQMLRTLRPLNFDLPSDGAAPESDALPSGSAASTPEG